MGNFLDKFPRVPYDINKSNYSNYENITDITFRFSVIKQVLDNTSAYYEYVIRDTETPEILADRVYGDPQSYWIILYANNIFDPQYDWPLNDDALEKFIISKYGSITNAKSQIHHYEKIIARQLENSETVYLQKQEVDYNTSITLTATIDNQTANISSSFVSQIVKQLDDTNTTIFKGQLTNIDLANNQLNLSIIEGKITNYLNLLDDGTNSILCRIIDNTQKDLDFYINLPETPQYSSYTVNNKTVREAITRNAVSCYDYEIDANNKKRNIKIIKKEYYGQIVTEFTTMTNSLPTFYRKLV